jgi:large subunit ribosomal protein L17
MRHHSKRHSFGRRHGPRIALIRSLVINLVEHGRIKTTLAKAKEARRHVEKAITLAKDGTLHSRRLLLSRYPNDATVDALSTDLKKRFAKRPGGYTRIIKIGARPGDQSDSAYLEFVDHEPKEAGTKETVKGAPKDAKKKQRAKAAAVSKLRKTIRVRQNKARQKSREIAARA